MSDSYFGWTLILRDVFCMFSGLGIGTLWFLPVLFFSYALLLLTVFAADGTKCKPILLTVCMIVAAQAAAYLENMHPEVYFSGMMRKIIEEYTYTGYRIINGYSFSLFGYLLRMLYGTNKKRIRMAMIGCLVLCFIPGCENYGASGMLLLGSLYLLNKDYITKALSYPVRFLIYCGKHSLEITIYHYIFLLPLEIMILKAFGFSGSGWFLFFINITSALAVIRFTEKNQVIQFLLTGKRSR